MESQHDADVVTVAEVASGLRVTKSTVFRWIRTGRLKALKLGQKSYRIRRADLAAFIQASELDHQAA